jgi:E3 ubiquitin-protein ligase RAD18
MLYNANLDRSAANRKTKAALRTELKKWEETISKRKKTVVPDAKQHVVSSKRLSKAAITI